MTDRSFTQTSFLAGEWSPSAMGRTDHPDYVKALAWAQNGYTTEEGSWTKRGGSMDLGATYHGNPGIIRTWYMAPAGTDPTLAQSVQLELTYGSSGGSRLRVWQWPFTSGPVYDVAAGYANLTDTMLVQIVPTDVGCYFLSKNVPPAILTYNGSAFSFGDAGFSVLDGPYLDPLPGQSQTKNSLGLVGGSGPGATTFQITDSAYTFLASDVGRCIRLWNQPPAWDGATAYATGDCVSYGGNYWEALANPPTGNIPGTQTQIGNFIVVPWGLVPQQASWAYGSITGFTSGSTVAIQLNTVLPFAFAVAPGNHGNGLVIDTWQIGVYTTQCYPATGCWHESRLWLGGARPNRIDASMTNGIPINPGSGLIVGNNGGLGPLFSYTDQYGTVLDNSGISEQFSANGTNMPIWMIPEQAGIVMGTGAHEWLISASNLNDPLTPTSIQCHPVTKYGAAQTKAVRVGIAIAFIQTFRRRVIEMVADVFSGRFIGRHINEFAKHLSNGWFRELSYQEEPIPLIWANDALGYLYSCTYRRVSHFGQEDPKMTAWSRHYIRGLSTDTPASNGAAGPARWVVSHTDCSFNAGQQSSVMLLTSATPGSTGAGAFTSCRVQLMMPSKDAGQAANASWYVDGSAIPSTLDVTETGSNFVVSLIPAYLRGQTVSIFLCGINAGTYTVSNAGVVNVPIASDPNGELTSAFVKAYQTLGISAGSWGIFGSPSSIGGGTGWVPMVVGLPFTTIMQAPRPSTAAATGGQTGEGVGKTRRTHMWGAVFADTYNETTNTVKCDLNTGANSPGQPALPAFPIVFKTYNGFTPLEVTALFSGVFQDTISCDANFDNQVTIVSSNPGPMTVGSITNFMNVEDR